MLMRASDPPGSPIGSQAGTRRRLPGGRIWDRREAMATPGPQRPLSRTLKSQRMRPDPHDQRGHSRTLGLHAGGAFRRLARRPLADRRRRDRAHKGDAGRRHGGDHRELPTTPSSPGARSRRRGAASSCACLARNCAPRRGSRRAGYARGRQDRLGGPWRSAGDDRHLRFRRRPITAIARPCHRLRAPRSPHDGDLASARPMRDHFRL